jgi:isocitrate dehydrogenase
MQPTPITIARGDGIGPEIMSVVLHLLNEAGARLAIEEIEIGESIYRQGFSAGIKPEAWESLRRTKVFLKAPITTSQGSGVKSLNVTIRKTLGLYANVRPCISYHPFIPTKHPKMDVVIIRENEEDLYAGIEHRQTDEVYQCLKLITRPGCEKIIRYAFEYVKRRGRKKLTCFTKDNIMKLTDGLFHQVFDEVASEYPDVETEHLIIDIGMARMAESPERFDVVVLPNLYGDIMSDVAAEISGSVGIAPSANIGDHIAMFEAIHGSAPDIAGKNLANPSGLILSAVKMLAHIGQGDIAAHIHNAWLRTIEEGIHTPDIFGANSRAKVGTKEFGEAVAKNLGSMPQTLHPAIYSTEPTPPIHYTPKAFQKKELIGVDVFLHWRGSPNTLGKALEQLNAEPLSLIMITNRGVKVYPDGFPETFCTDHWRCRFTSKNNQPITHANVLRLLNSLEQAHYDFIKTEHLYYFDGKAGFSLGQGQ